MNLPAAAYLQYLLPEIGPVITKKKYNLHFHIRHNGSDSCRGLAGEPWLVLTGRAVPESGRSREGQSSARSGISTANNPPQTSLLLLYFSAEEIFPLRLCAFVVEPSVI